MSEDQSIERWAKIPFASTLHEVSTHGRVRNFKTGRIIYQKTSKKLGYKSVNLGRDNTHIVHRLVLGAFVGPCPLGMECCHRDGNGSNNALANLRWGTRLENIRESRTIKVTPAIVRTTKKMRNDGIPKRTIAATLGLHRQTIAVICAGEKDYLLAE